MKKQMIITFLVLATCAAAWAERPLQVSITPEAALFDRGVRINGLALNLWGENPQTAIALGLVNGSSGDSGGASLALLMNYGEHYTGLHAAPINVVSGDFTGLQLGAVNIAGRLKGLQVGVFNMARYADGGLQLGLLNIISENDAWFTDLPEELAPGMAFINWRF